VIIFNLRRGEQVWADPAPIKVFFIISKSKERKMYKRLLLAVVALILLSLAGAISAFQQAQARQLNPLPIDPAESPRPSDRSPEKYYCFLDYSNWNAAWYLDQWKLGDKIAIWFDPGECGYPQNYPFQLEQVDLMLYDIAGVGSVDVRFSVEIVCPDICDGPGIEIYESQIYTITCFYPLVETIIFPDTICLDKPFFFNVEYVSDYPLWTMPSLVFDAQAVDTCYQWLWLGEPSWWEWYDIWQVVPGWALLTVAGNCGEEHTSCGEWYFKPDTLPEAPSGIPDFDQNQDGWTAYCGPAAVANCLWWYDAVPQGMTPPELIELMAAYLNTGPGGTTVEDIETGLGQYFQDYGFAFEESTFWMPDFHEMEDSLEKCQDIILLLGFWWYEQGAEQQFKRGDVDGDGTAATLADLTVLLHGPPFACEDAADVNDDGILDTTDCVYLSDYLVYGEPLPPPPFSDCGPDPTADQLDCASYHHCPGQWWREGGHYVTMAGVNSEKREIAIADPDRDQCESVPGWPGRVLPLGGHPPHPGDPYVHNDPQMVSHDIYVSLLHPEFPSPGSDNWDLADYCYQPGRYPGVNVPQRFRNVTRESSKHFQYWHTEVEAAIMICPKPNDPPQIDQPDFLEGYVDDSVEYVITGNDPDGDVILDDASITIFPGCGQYSITRITGHGTSSGMWRISWYTDGCAVCDTHTVVHGLTDAYGLTGYCTTYVHLSESPDWHWKEGYEDYAPSGMPDIDQRQDTWIKTGTDQWTFCGPCAVANCFVWFDSKHNIPPGLPGDGQDQFPLVRDYLDELAPLSGYDDHDPMNADHIGTLWGPGNGAPPLTTQPFVPGVQVPGGGLPPWGELAERLAWYFDTDGIQTGYCQHAGTDVLQMQEGIQMWLESETMPDGSSLADLLCEVTTQQPAFDYVASLVEKSEDVILLLGFWYENPPGSGEWWRVGGHYVTVAGVNLQDFMIAFSDPFANHAELGHPGRVGDGWLIGHEHGLHNPTVHNDEGNVSHDIYSVGLSSPSPGGLWGIHDYAVQLNPAQWMWNFRAQNVPDEFESMTAAWDGESPVVTEVEYCVHISPWDYRGDLNVPGGDGVVDAGDVVYLIGFLFKGFPAPDPYIEGDVNCDGVVGPGDVVRLINYLFKGWPPPRCCS
jgi:hypothetical protein